MVQIRNCFYRGADRTSFAPNYPPWYIELDVKTKHVKSRFIYLVAHIKRYYARKTPPAPDFDKLVEFFLGRPIPFPELDHPDEAQP